MGEYSSEARMLHLHLSLLANFQTLSLTISLFKSDGNFHREWADLLGFEMEKRNGSGLVAQSVGRRPDRLGTQLVHKALKKPLELVITRNQFKPKPKVFK